MHKCVMLNNEIIEGVQLQKKKSGSGPWPQAWVAKRGLEDKMRKGDEKARELRGRGINR